MRLYCNIREIMKYHIIGQWSSSGHIYSILSVSMLWVDGAIYKPEHCMDAETHSLCRGSCWCVQYTVSAVLTFRQADRSPVIQVISGFGGSEPLLVRAEAKWRFVSWGWGCEYSRPTFRWRDFNTHQTVLPPSVTDPCLPMGKHERQYSNTLA